MVTIYEVDDPEVQPVFSMKRIAWKITLALTALAFLLATAMLFVFGRLP